MRERDEENNFCFSPNFEKHPPREQTLRAKQRTTVGFYFPPRHPPMKPFTKPALSLQEQISLLRSRGLGIPDPVRATRYLQFIGYYRLMAYARPYQGLTDGSHTFADGTTFDDLLELYVFDRKLRLHTMDAIERLEVALRTVINNYLSLKYDQFWFMDKSLFVSSYNHSQLLKDLEKGTRNGGHPFCVAYYKKYDYPHLPPSWMVAEVLSLGQWSIIYANLTHAADQKAIANIFKVPYMTLKSWLRSLSTLRNICAHHGLVWNRKIAFPPSLASHFRVPDPDHYYARGLVVWQLMSAITNHSSWLSTLKTLLLTCPRPISEMGFPDGWQLLPGW